MSSNLTIVIVHGSYHTPAPYEPLRKALESRGYETHCPQLPCSNLENLVINPSNPDFSIPPPPAGHPPQSADSDVVKVLLKTLVEEQGKNVLLVAHSSGGWSATEAVVPEFQLAQREKEEKIGGVIGIFYVAAFVVEMGGSVAGQIFDDLKHDLDWITFHEIANLGTINNPRHYFFHDLEEEEANRWSQTLTACPFLMSPLTNDAYSVVPLGYLICEGNRVLPQAFQEKMIKMTEERSGKNVEIYRCKGGHQAFLSCTLLVADAIAKFANKNSG